MSRLLIIAVFLFTALQYAHAAEDSPPPGGLAEAVVEIESLDAMRSGLAGAFGGTGAPADEAAFKEVCKPVGMKAKQIAEENGWTVVQMAEMYRNPAHKLDTEGEKVYRIMEADRSIKGVWILTRMDGTPGVRYFRRITVEPACLACHGGKDARPDFIKQKYPEDRAYGFKAGDLRGVYSVFIPSPDSD